MHLFFNALMFYLLQILFLLFYVINYSCALSYPGGNYYGAYYERQEQEKHVKLALEKLDHEPDWVRNWPDSSITLGQVSGVALDASGNVLVFHRSTNIWDSSTFSDRDVYMNIGEPPISHPTILVFNETGNLIDAWGENFFHIPHGITVDAAGNVWVTDVARHQVFKFTPSQRQQPALQLGEKFVPGDDDHHFCKPSAVAVMRSGDFFVADGYCNTRIIKFAPDGTRILQWGRSSGESPFTLKVPHALALAEERDVLLVADRERGRVAAFRAANGSYVAAFRHWLLGPRLFAVAYAPVHGGRLYVVNGPTLTRDVPVRGYVIDYESGRLIQTFATGDQFSNPHDIVVSPDGSRVYVAELDPARAYKFVDESLRNASRADGGANATAPVKPTATVGE